jgi:hypothetical protein
MKFALAVAAIFSIYLGYRLFCGLPFRKTRAMLIVNGVSGAALAVFGMAILGADAWGIQKHPATDSRQIHKVNPAEKGSFSPLRKHRDAADWLV